MRSDDLLRPWSETLLAGLPELRLFDAHTHTGANDPDGFRCTAAELTAALAEVGGRAVVFPFHEPDGYTAANERVLAEAAGSEGRLVAFCRLDPHREDAGAETARLLERGAAGVKLHPRAERFTLDHPGVRAVVAVAHERRRPVLVHAGRGIPALGRHALQLCTAFPDARLVLAHCAVSDLAWIWREAPAHPNLFFDTSWWSPADQYALLTLVPPGRILFGSDTPYGTPLQASLIMLRSALQAGLSREQIDAIAGAQLERLLAGDEPLDAGPPPAPKATAPDPLLERVATFLTASLGALLPGLDAPEALGLARLACDVPDDHPRAALFRSIATLLDLKQDRARDVEPDAVGRRHAPGIHLVVAALCLCATPDVPVPT
jgi:predicted TIM-barrel fold metal-dependent hydrolase